MLRSLRVFKGKESWPQKLPNRKFRQSQWDATIRVHVVQELNTNAAAEQIGEGPRLSPLAALHESDPGTSLTSRDVRLESAKWAKADIDRVAHHQLRFYEYT